MIKIGGCVFPAFVPYGKAAFEIYVSGCTRKCNGCHNPELECFDFGLDTTIEEYITKILLPRADFYDIIAVTGGDLLCQNTDEAEHLAKMLRQYFPDKELWLFTGEEDIVDVPQWAKNIFDVIKTGKYDKERLVDAFPSSSNQKVLHKEKDY